MYKFRPLPDNILENLSAARVVLEEHPAVLFAYLFGGLAKEEPTVLSDVDIAVFLRSSSVMSDTKLEILGLLLDALSTDEVDLVVLNTAPLPLKAAIVQNKLPLADKDPFFRHKFESLTLREYFDFAVKEKFILRRRYGLG